MGRDSRPERDARTGGAASEASGHHPLTLSKTAEHFTPGWILDGAREVMGGIDVDPCSCREAQKVVRARQYFDAGRNGLVQRWKGRAFINPPGDTRGKLPKLFWEKLVVEIQRGRLREFLWLAFNVSHLRTLQFDDQVLPACDLCILRDRIRFTGDSPTKDNALLYWGPNRDRFAAVFASAGTVWRGRGGAPKRTRRARSR